MITNCLTYEQLQAYSTHTVNGAEHGHLYMHISSCELCACAVNGFAASPFASDELVAIHREIDARTNATAANPLTFARVFIVVISLLSIAGVYELPDVIREKPLPAGAEYSAPAIPVIPGNHEKKSASEEKISSVTTTFKKIINVIEYKKSERAITPIGKLELIKPAGIASISVKDEEAAIIAPHFNRDAIYIYNLKVSDYNSLYFGHAQTENALFKTHTPVFKENKTSIADDFGMEQHVVPADRVLKEGLASFSKQNFGAAIESFSLLLENNPSDVNAQFYSALAYYNLDRTSRCVACLNEVLKNSNDTFYPEAQWYLALVNLKTGNREIAKQQLQRIVSEKGFYSKRAAERLKGL
jgi:tetratricopeptide (TPR) repeat protein